MDADIPERLGKMEFKLSEHDEEIIAHDRTLTAIRNLIHMGIRMLVDMEVKINALADSHAKLYGTVQEVVELHKQLAEAQKRTEESLRRFLDRSGNGRAS